MYRSTVVVGAIGSDQFYPLGTGTFFRTTSGVVCVTAAHVISKVGLCGGVLGIIDCEGHVLPIYKAVAPGGEGIVRLAPDPADVAVIRLPEPLPETLHADSILHWPEGHAEEDASDVSFCFLGFSINALGGPWQCASIPQSIPFHFVAGAYEGPTKGLANYNPHLHLLFVPGRLCNRAEKQDVWASSFLLDFPYGMGGMSGCTVWKLNGTRDRMSQPAEDSQKIVALQTGLYPSTRIVKATKWTVVSSLL